MTSGYFSHYIRGKKGLEATKEDMDRNREHASLVAKQLQILVPDLKLYVPADNDAFVDFGYRAGMLTEQLILDVDCAIIDEQDVVIFYDPDNCISQSRGMMREFNHTQDTDKPWCLIHDVDIHAVMQVKGLTTVAHS